MEKLVSVIVPVYNAERYLEKCMESIAFQTYQNIEIILINDGSSDRSGEICAMFQEKYANVVLINQSNAGNTNARKKGLAYAQGEYVVFVDSDDWMPVFSIAELYHYMEEHDADMVIANYSLYKDKHYLERRIKIPEGLYDEAHHWQMLCENFFESGGQFSVLHNIWGKMYRTSFYRKAQSYVSDQITIGEDLLCLYICLLMHPRIYISHKVNYYYRETPDSLIRRINERSLCDINNIYLAAERLRNTFNDDFCLRMGLNRYLKGWASGEIDKLFGGKSSNMYLFPFEKVEKNSRILIYGAGRIGQSYRKQVISGHYCILTGLIDKNGCIYREKGLEVFDIDEIENTLFDKVVIAIGDRAEAELVRQMLMEKGIEKEKIVCEEVQIISDCRMLSCI